MKTLLLMRHAKSSWDDPALDDHQRPLNDRGKSDAPRMGRLLLDEHIVPDYVLCSTAKRASKTATLVAQAAGYGGQIEALAELYHAGPPQIAAMLRQINTRYARVLLVAHNPALQELLELLTGTQDPFPTAALAHIAIDVNDWSELQTQSPARLVKLWRPRELE